VIDRIAIDQFERSFVIVKTILFDGILPDDHLKASGLISIEEELDCSVELLVVVDDLRADAGVSVEEAEVDYDEYY